MKKQVFLVLFLTVAMIAGCSKSDDNVTSTTNTEIKAKLNVEFEEVFENTIYPSAIFSTASLKNVQKNQLTYFNLKINSDKEFDGKIRVTNDVYTDLVYNDDLFFLEEISIIDKQKFEFFYENYKDISLEQLEQLAK